MNNKQGRIVWISCILVCILSFATIHHIVSAINEIYTIPPNIASDPNYLLTYVPGCLFLIDSVFIQFTNKAVSTEFFRNIIYLVMMLSLLIYLFNFVVVIVSVPQA